MEKSASIHCSIHLNLDGQSSIHQLQTTKIFVKGNSDARVEFIHLNPQPNSSPHWQFCRNKSKGILNLFHGQYRKSNTSSSTILEKKVGTVCLIWFKKSPRPFPPMQCWPESCCQRPRQVAQHWLKGVGKDMTNGELGGFFKTMHCPKCPYIGTIGIIAIKWIKCPNSFFPGLSERNPKFFIWNWFFDHNFKTKCPIPIKFRTHNYENTINVSSNQHK